jgi:cell division protease FtsH
MGKMLGSRRTHWGQKILGKVDAEVERLVNGSYCKAKEILENNMDLLHHLAKVLVEQEVVSTEEFQMMLIEFNAKTANFELLGSDRRREDLPFQELPIDYTI